jgi:hypothetical protein
MFMRPAVSEFYVEPGYAAGHRLKTPLQAGKLHAGNFCVDRREQQFTTGGTTGRYFMSNTYVPLISSGVAGPLGVLHLPRLWLKASLEARGKLAAGYPGCGKGYDQMVLDGLGLDRQKTLDFIKNNKPTYNQFEGWVKQQPGVRLDKGSIDKLNGSIRGYDHDDATRKNILSAAGLQDDASACKDAVNLNNLDDWTEFHAAVLK